MPVVLTIAMALREAKTQLLQLTEEAGLEAEILLAFVLKVDRSYLYAWPEKPLTKQESVLFDQLVARRLAKEPMAYIVGTQEFWSLNLKVDCHTLIPRPDTETLIETVLTLFPNHLGKMTMVDLGTGSGAIAIALAHERPNWKVWATDISPKALHVAKQNAQAHLLTEQIQFVESDWFSTLPSMKFDLIVSNPPYITQLEWPIYAANLAYEPITALVSGQDGLEAIRQIVSMAPAYLKSAGYLVIEHGFQQGAALFALMKAAGFSQVRSISDLSGKIRTTVGYYLP